MVDGGALPDDSNHVNYDGWQFVTQGHYDHEDGPELASAIVSAVAEAKDVAPLDPSLPTLYDSLDAAALEKSFYGTPGVYADDDEESVVTFTYASVKVTLQRDGWILVHEPVEP